MRGVVLWGLELFGGADDHCDLLDYRIVPDKWDYAMRYTRMKTMHEASEVGVDGRVEFFQVLSAVRNKHLIKKQMLDD